MLAPDSPIAQRLEVLRARADELLVQQQLHSDAGSPPLLTGHQHGAAGAGRSTSPYAGRAGSGYGNGGGSYPGSPTGGQQQQQQQQQQLLRQLNARVAALDAEVEQERARRIAAESQVESVLRQLRYERGLGHGPSPRPSSPQGRAGSPPPAGGGRPTSPYGSPGTAQRSASPTGRGGYDAPHSPHGHAAGGAGPYGASPHYQQQQQSPHYGGQPAGHQQHPQAGGGPGPAARPKKGTLHVLVERAADLPNADEDEGYGWSDPFVLLQVGMQTKKTTVKDDVADPVYNEDFAFDVRLEDRGGYLACPLTLHVEVFDKDLFKSDPLGSADLPLDKLLLNTPTPLDFPIYSMSGEPAGRVYLQLHAANFGLPC